MHARARAGPPARGRRAPCEEDTGDGESFMSFKTKPFSEPIQLSGWRRRYVYITKNRDGVYVLRYHDASKVESIQSSTDWDLASRIRSASHRRDTLHRLLKPAYRGEFALSTNPEQCRIRLLNDNRAAKYKTPHVLEIICDVDEKGSVVLCMETSEERMLWIRTLKGLQHAKIEEKLKMKRVSFERKLGVDLLT